MTQPISNLAQLLRTMEPVRNPGVYVFASLPHGSDVSALEPVATVREREGVTVVVDESVAQAAQLQVLFRAAWITLNVHSDLQAVGLTAAFATALGQANISCNVIAGAFHDHIFVSVESAHEAMATLRVLQKKYAAMYPNPPFGG
jgi:uncharacterized protein